MMANKPLNFQISKTITVLSKDPDIASVFMPYNNIVHCNKWYDKIHTI